MYISWHFPGYHSNVFWQREWRQSHRHINCLRLSAEERSLSTACCWCWEAHRKKRSNISLDTLSYKRQRRAEAADFGCEDDGLCWMTAKPISHYIRVSLSCLEDSKTHCADVRMPDLVAARLSPPQTLMFPLIFRTVGDHYWFSYGWFLNDYIWSHKSWKSGQILQWQLPLLSLEWWLRYDSFMTFIKFTFKMTCKISHS